MFAPLHADMFGQGIPAKAEYVLAADDTRLRVAEWRTEPSRRGTVFILTGRTEYIEMYAELAEHCVQSGYAVFGLDWRGQGLSDRKCSNGLIGHVDHFSEYQLDLQALLNFAETRHAPQPWFVISHSMGGAILLGALQSGVRFERAVFSAPMWDIYFPGVARRLAPALAAGVCALGMGSSFMPGATTRPYPNATPFDGNLLTSDPEIYQAFGVHLEAYPELALAGPSAAWLRTALNESEILRNGAEPTAPALVLLGEHEGVVDAERIHSLTSKWSGFKLNTYAGARHDPLMERPEIRSEVLRDVITFFARS